MPQETGNRTGVRYAEITDDCGHGVRLSAAYFPESGDPEASRPGTMEFSAIPYSPAQLEAAKVVKADTKAAKYTVYFQTMDVFAGRMKPENLEHLRALKTSVGL